MNKKKEQFYFVFNLLNVVTVTKKLYVLVYFKPFSQLTYCTWQK
jgi:hypothetical protein